MIITVNNGISHPIEGIASQASIAVAGEKATVSISVDQLIRTPRNGQTLTFADAEWIVERITNRTAHIVTFICRKITNG